MKPVPTSFTPCLSRSGGGLPHGTFFPQPHSALFGPAGMALLNETSYV